MGRAQAIIAGYVLLAISILALDGYLFFSTRRPPASEASSPTVARDEPTAFPFPRAADPPPAVPAADAPTSPSPTLPDESGGGAQDPMLQRWQRLQWQRRRQVIEAADQQVFERLNLPDTARTAIRAADSDYARAIQPSADGLPDPNAERTRRAAIANILDPETMHAFNLAERAAERRARRQYRPELVQGR